ncbi:MAG: hypothetical protein U5L09_05145 [Bacteroidales bacterium]|nr:hypothetical protein [Bacteroidales bacterium]
MGFWYSFVEATGTLYRFGSYVKVLKTTSSIPETGEMGIIIEGRRTFLLSKHLPNHEGKPYDSALIEWLDDGYSKSCQELIDIFKDYYKGVKKDFRAFKNVDKLDNIWSIVKFLPLTEDEKIRFISLCNAERRGSFLSRIKSGNSTASIR